MADAAGLHEEMFDVIQSKDFDHLRELCHADYVYSDATGAQIKGADAAVEVAQKYTSAFPDLRFDILHHHACGDSTSVIEFKATGTHKGELEGIAPTGKKVSMAACNVIEVKDGKIVRETDYFDTMALMQQLGVVE